MTEHIPGISRWQALVDEACSRGRAVADQGAVAEFIPELAKNDPNLVGVSLELVDGGNFAAGDVDFAFTLQSISKVFALASVQSSGGDPYARMYAEPSGDAFHSIVRLEEERGRPRNPLINAGAIVVSSLIEGAAAEDKFGRFVAFLARCSGGERFAMDDAVYLSECKTGNRNRALANFMKHYGVLDDPETAVDAYFRQCSVVADVRQLARLGLFLANDGKDPVSGERILSKEANRQLLAVMTLCGLYDEVGRFALRVGLPAKSGVSGGILAIVPGEMSIAVVGPALGKRGNSVAGMAALEYLSAELGLTVFAPRAAFRGSPAR